MKKIIALLLVLAMAFGLVACGGSEPAATEAPKTEAPAAAPEAPAAAEKVEVNMIAAQYGNDTHFFE